MKEGNIISFKVFIDNKGTLMTEYSKLPMEKVKEIFEYPDSCYVEKILKELEPKLFNLHKSLEEELTALK